MNCALLKPLKIKIYEVPSIETIEQNLAAMEAWKEAVMTHANGMQAFVANKKVLLKL